MSTSQAPTNTRAIHTFQLERTNDRIELKREWKDGTPEGTRLWLDGLFVGLLNPDPDGADVSLVVSAFWYNADHLRTALQHVDDHGLYVPMIIPDHDDTNSGLFLQINEYGMFSIFLSDPHWWDITRNAEETRSYEGATVELDETGAVLRCWFSSLDGFLNRLQDGPFVLPPSLGLNGSSAR